MFKYLSIVLITIALLLIGCDQAATKAGDQANESKSADKNASQSGTQVVTLKVKGMT